MFAFKNRRNFKVGEFLGDTRSTTSSSVEASDEILEHMMYKMEKLILKETKLWWDITTLEKYLAHNTIPKGLNIHKQASFVSEDGDFNTQWDKILKECSFSLINLIIKDRRKQLTVLNHKIDELKELASPFNDMEDFKSLEIAILDRIERKEDEIIAKKKRKLIRDGVDREEPDFYTDLSLDNPSPHHPDQIDHFKLPSNEPAKKNTNNKKNSSNTNINKDRDHKTHQPDCALYNKDNEVSSHHKKSYKKSNHHRNKLEQDNQRDRNLSPEREPQRHREPYYNYDQRPQDLPRNHPEPRDNRDNRDYTGYRNWGHYDHTQNYFSRPYGPYRNQKHTPYYRSFNSRGNNYNWRNPQYDYPNHFQSQGYQSNYYRQSERQGYPPFLGGPRRETRTY